ncbi:hypothetical protein JMJ77_0009502 [Colletotrichum scovillei]|uniref:Uncharacterized protein n=1 Tax=Colletotrichum scovillei TaxID=1209932 RepID=A0A9P7QZH5_9PEZI|nr:hypothetical protein JMJ77_0009502 [Colletotrichum scovillei]KAG7052582.1 hypothetical protein JMJ78_0005598 [Colletotrichum scovillei]KAG7064872.1 hypothetical protein JMJ76_0012630 [Colletotrichum scovillei]
MPDRKRQAEVPASLSLTRNIDLEITNISLRADSAWCPASEVGPQSPMERSLGLQLQASNLGHVPAA